MEKKITVYVVTCNNVEQVFPTKSQANTAMDALVKFGHTPELKQDKRTVKLA